MLVSASSFRFARSRIVSLLRTLSLSSLPLHWQLILTALLFINARSFPLVWHVRVLRHFLLRSIRSQYYLPASPSAKSCDQDIFNPFETLTIYRCWAGPDDCDFLFHLSNSSYAKNLDLARAAVCTKRLGNFIQEGGWFPLAGANYLYIVEIPMFSSYEIRSRIGSWDDKWLYLVSEFVTTSRESTPKFSTDTSGLSRGSVRADGTILHCVAISIYCFKLGRITIPPRIALSVCGLGDASTDEARIHLMEKEGKLREFLETGWRHEEGWDLPEFESRRLRGLECCHKLMDGIKEAVKLEN